MNPDVLRHHIQSLADQHRIQLVHEITNIDHAAAQRITGTIGDHKVEFRIVHTPTVVDALTYSTALHELGHLIAEGACRPRLPDGTPAVRQYVDLIEQEDLAWTWAREHALVWTVDMEHDAIVSRETYRKGLEYAFRAGIRGTTHPRISTWK